jgi:DNA-binding transcriptional ArsR family regulator
MANISTERTAEETIAQYFRILGQPVRIKILLLLSKNDTCVCHLEAYLGMRQALISQHLMVLRDGGLVSFYRDGRNIYYQVSNAEVLDVVRQVGKMLGIPAEQLEGESFTQVSPCPCPHCNPGSDISCSRLSA